MESVTDSVTCPSAPHVERPDSGAGIDVAARLLDRAPRPRVSSTAGVAALTSGSVAIRDLGELEAMMVDVDDAGACAWAALEIALVGLTADLRRHRRDHVVSLGVVGATERLSASLQTLSTRTTGHGARSGGQPSAWCRGVPPWPSSSTTPKPWGCQPSCFYCLRGRRTRSRTPSACSFPAPG